MKIQYSNKFIQKLVMVDPTTFVYHFIYDEKDSVDTNIIQYFIIRGLCIKVDSYVAHMFYEWSFNHNTAVPIYVKTKKYFLYLNTNATVFAQGAGNYIKNII